MPITFTPTRGHILICDFDIATVPPEMRKVRRVVVVSPRSYNKHRRAIVVPLSASQPLQLRPSHVPFPAGVFKSLPVPTWAICDCVAHVSFDRLDRVRVGKRALDERAGPAWLTKVEAGLRAALGIP